MRIVNHNIILRLKEEQNSTNVLEVSLVINHYYDMSRSLKWRAQRRKNVKKTAIKSYRKLCSITTNWKHCTYNVIF